MNQYIISIAIALIVVAAGASLTQAQIQSTDRFTISIDNEGSRVSPGGELRFNIKGSRNQGYDDIELHFSVDTDGIVERYSKSYVSWHQTEPTTNRRFFAIYINKNIPLLPKTLTLRAKNPNSYVPGFDATATFTIEQGRHGHRFKEHQGKYVQDLRLVPDSPVFYRLTCIEGNASKGHCRMSFKNGVFHPHDSATKIVARPRYGCTDEDWHAGSRLAIRSPFVFDMSKLVNKKEKETTASPGETLHESAVCRIISDGPILIEEVKVVPQVH